MHTLLYIPIAYIAMILSVDKTLPSDNCPNDHARVMSPSTSPQDAQIAVAAAAVGSSQSHEIYENLIRRLKDPRKDVQSIGHPDLKWDETLLSLMARRSQDVQEVSLTNSQASDEVLRRLAATLKLKSLGIHLKRDVNRFPILREFSSLERLALKDSEITDEDLVHLGGMPNLSSLILTRCTKIKGHGLVYLWNSRNLRYLDLSGTSLDLRAAQSLRTVSSLQILILSNTMFTDTDLQFLEDLPHLRHLYLENCKGIDGSFLHLVKSNIFLTFIDLSGSIANNECLEDVFEIKQLRSVDLRRSQVTKQGISWYLDRGGPWDKVIWSDKDWFRGVRLIE